LAQGGVTGDEQKEARWRGVVVLEHLDEVEKQSLPGRGEQVDSIEIKGNGKG
jgi:hypothetical protein